MKHAREDYNRIQDPENKIPADEPVFLLRAQDVLAAPTVLHYAELTRSHGGDPRIVQTAFEQAKLMRQWPVQKLADLPSEESEAVIPDHDIPTKKYRGKKG